MGTKSLIVLVCLVAWASPAFAATLEGCVYCDTNNNGVLDCDDKPLPGVFFLITGSYSFCDSELTDSCGCYHQGLPDKDACYKMVIDMSTLPPGSVVLDPPGGVFEFCISYKQCYVKRNWLIDCPEPEKACWLTGGGVKFSSITGTKMAEHGPDHNFGGNVFPSCDPDPGDGGNWNHISHDDRLHFQGKVITRVECGNVEGIEPGSESPVTPHNFIEFSGIGTLKGIKGNKADYGTVRFFARCEDRNEPGSRGAKDGIDVDRYFLHVFDSDGNTLLLVDMDGNPATVDPITITGGNLQIHISSCDDPPDFAR